MMCGKNSWRFHFLYIYTFSCIKSSEYAVSTHFQLSALTRPGWPDREAAFIYSLYCADGTKAFCIIFIWDLLILHEKRKHSQARSRHRMTEERGKQGPACVCVCVCVHASDRGLSAYLKEPLCQALSTAGQKASNKQPACKQTIQQHCTGWGGRARGGRRCMREAKGFFFFFFLSQGGGTVSQQTI